MPQSTLASLLRQFRVAADLSQEQLAERVQISLAAIGAYERGLRMAPHPATLDALADALDLTGPERTALKSAGCRRKGKARAPGPLVVDRRDTAQDGTSFVGRDVECRAIAALMNRHRLVTVTGPGGVGKTRTALVVARHAAESRRDGFRFVDFGSCENEVAVLRAVASALDVASPQHEESRREELVAGCKRLDLILLFDNCEHVLDATRQLAALIVQTCPGIAIIATSRERLRISAEATYRLSAFAVPNGSVSSASAARHYDAIELFEHRAGAAEPNFVLSDANACAVAEVCAMVDGLPLAIEIAAALLPGLGLSALHDRLRRQIPWHALGNRDAPTRQQTLWTNISWSYQRLPPVEQRVFRRLSLLEPGWTMHRAHDVCRQDEHSERIVNDAVSTLVETSFITMRRDACEAAFVLSRLTRLFANEVSARTVETT